MNEDTLTWAIYKREGLERPSGLFYDYVAIHSYVNVLGDTISDIVAQDVRPSRPWQEAYIRYTTSENPLEYVTAGSHTCIGYIELPKTENWHEPVSNYLNMLILVSD